MVRDTGNRYETAFQKYLEKVIYFCNAENISPNVVVHEIRRTFKRIRALLKFYSGNSELFFSECKNQIKTFGKMLSVLRESAVNIQILERITANTDLIPERKIRQIKDLLLEQNKKLLKDYFQEKEVGAQIRTFCKQAEEYVHIFERERPSKQQIFECLSTEYERSFLLFQKVETDYDAEEMHNLRKKLKALMYQFEFLKFLQPRYFKLKSDQLNTITEQIGEDHDLFVFVNDLKILKYTDEGEEKEMLENHVQHLREIIHTKLSGRLKLFFSEPPEMFNQKIRDILKI